jgi:hypothetical protein
MGRVLAPGGRLLLECEHRWSLDLLWALLSSLTGDRLGFGLTPRRALAALRPPWRASLVTDYPLAITRADVAVLRLRLFTRTDLDASLADAGLVTVRAWGIHVTTNLFPSTVLHRERLGRLASAAYRALCFVDDRIRAWPPARYAANSLVLLAVKRRPDPRRRAGRHSAAATASSAAPKTPSVRSTSASSCATET